MDQHIKRINRELKFKGKIIDFYQDTMEITGEDGTHTAVWDFIRHKGAAAVVPVTDDGRILMVRQYRNALERYTLEIPAGALDAEDEPGLTWRPDTGARIWSGLSRSGQRWRSVMKRSKYMWRKT